MCSISKIKIIYFVRIVKFEGFLKFNSLLYKKLRKFNVNYKDNEANVFTFLYMSLHSYRAWC